MSVEISFSSGALSLDDAIFDFNAFFPFDVSCFYNSLLDLQSGFGRNRTSLLDVTIHSESNELIYRNEYGRRIYFDRPSPDVGKASRNARYPEYYLSAGARGSLCLRNGALTSRFEKGSDAIWRLTRFENLNGDVVALTRDADHLVTRVEHPCGLSLVFENNDRKLRTRVSLIGTGGATQLIAECRYDARGNLVGLDRPFGSPRYYTYDGRDCLIAWSDGGATQVRYDFDAQCRVVRRSVGDQAADIVAYEDAARRTTLLPGGREDIRAVMEFDEDRRLCRKSYPTGTAFENVFDDAGQLVAKRDGLGFETRAAYDGNGNLTSVVDAEGRRDARTFDDFRNILSTTDGDGNTWRWEYDERSNLITKVDPLGHITTFSNDAAGMPVGIMRHDGLIEQRAYDAQHRLVRLLDYRGGVTTFERDGFGRVVARTDPLGNVIRFTYEERTGTDFWSAARITWPNGATRSQVAGPDSSTRVVVDGEGRRATYRFGPFERLEESQNADGARLRFAYDHEGRIARVENQLGRVWTFERDAAGNLVRETDFDGLTILGKYDAADRLVEKRLADGARIASTYDRSGLVLREEAWEPGASEPAITCYRYDGRGIIAAVENGAAQVVIERDGMARITAEAVNGRRVESRYDCCGYRIERRIGERSVVSSYDPLGAVRGITVHGHAPLMFQRDALGRDLRRENGAGLRLEQAWDAVGELLRQKGGSGPETGLAVDRTYEWGRAFAPLRTLDRRWGETAYEHDANGQVAQALHGDGFAERFAYDPALNVAGSAGKGSRFEAWRLGPGGRVLQAIGPLGERVHLAYDERRRVVERRVERNGFRPKVWRYAWDARDQLVSCETPAGETWAYAYDPFGRRVSKQRLLGEREQAWVRVRQPKLVPAAFERSSLDVWPERPPGADPSGERPPAVGTTYLWDGDVVAEEAPLRLDGSSDGDAATRWHYEPGTFVPLAKEDADGALSYVVTDHLGTPREMLDEAGRLVWAGEQYLWGGLRRAWTADNDNMRTTAPEPRGGRTWGALALKDDPAAADAVAICPIRFQGQWEDAETGLFYNRFRHYDPIAAQYVSPDPVGLFGDFRSHAYASDPQSAIDPFGLASKKYDPCGKDATGRPLSSPHYSNAGDVQLPQNQMTTSDRSQFQYANEQLFNQMRDNPEFGNAMKQQYPGLKDLGPGPKGAFPGGPPSPGELTWHHSPDRPGVLELVPYDQHRAPGPVQQSLHPCGKGGKENWGGGR